jgi:hypothetical protein
MAWTARPTHRRITAELVRKRIEAEGERFWRVSDFGTLPPSAVAKALSRLAQQDVLERIGKGLYYRPRMTALGRSRPSRAKLSSLPLKRKRMFPAGLTAANLLGFTTQNPGKPEIATDSGSLPRQVVGASTVIRTRRPAAWQALTKEDAALLDFLRTRGASSELSPKATVSRVVALASEGDRIDRLLRVAKSEPPRVRAMLGAIGEQLGMSDTQLKTLKSTINALSRFDFGALSALDYAEKWRAKRA